jgi:ParB family chromosome partitioning protein
VTLAHSDPLPLRKVRLENIRPNPHQPRSILDESTLAHLAASIRSAGVLQPVLLRALGDGTFQLVAGERRWRAAQLAGLEAIPAIIHEANDARAVELALIENLQREDLGPLERATAYQQLIDTTGATVDDLAKRLGESRAGIANYLRLLKLSDPVCELINAGRLAMGQARAIAGISNPQRQLAVALLAVRRNLSVRQVETLAKDDRGAADAGRPTRPAAPTHINDVEQAFRKALGLTVNVLPGKKKNSGRLVIRYNSLEEFDRISEQLGVRSATE